MSPEQIKYREFAALNEWKLALRQVDIKDIGKSRINSYFNINQYPWEIGRFFDHERTYRAGKYYCAISTEPYQHAHDTSILKPWLNQRNLDLYMPPYPLSSIHYPGATIFLVIAPLHTHIVWPDYMNRPHIRRRTQE
jgi:hypothetical protein